MPARLRCSTVRPPAISAQLAWLRRAEDLARQQAVAAWRPANIEPLVADLISLTACAEDTAHVRGALARWGVRCVFLRHLSKTYLDGAAFYVEEAPSVALTLRYDRIDSFWFTLMHEVAHLAEGDQMCYLDVTEERPEVQDSSHPMDELTATEPDPHEAWANQKASEWLIVPDAFDAFIAAERPFFSRARILAFASSQRRHPGIVLGRLHREGLVPYKNLRGLLAKVSPYLKDDIAE